MRANLISEQKDQIDELEKELETFKSSAANNVQEHNKSGGTTRKGIDTLIVQDKKNRVLIEILHLLK